MVNAFVLKLANVTHEASKSFVFTQCFLLCPGWLDLVEVEVEV